MKSKNPVDCLIAPEEQPIPVYISLPYLTGEDALKLVAVLRGIETQLWCNLEREMLQALQLRARQEDGFVPASDQYQHSEDLDIF